MSLFFFLTHLIRICQRYCLHYFCSMKGGDAKGRRGMTYLPMGLSLRSNLHLRMADRKALLDDLAAGCLSNAQLDGVQVHYDLWHNSSMGQRYSWLAITSGAADGAPADTLLGQAGGSLLQPTLWVTFLPGLLLVWCCLRREALHDELKMTQVDPLSTSGRTFFPWQHKLHFGSAFPA